MDDIAASDLKTILLSKRANIYYLQHCRVLVNGGRVEYVTDADKQSLYWNIPIANTSVVLLGTGTTLMLTGGLFFYKTRKLSWPDQRRAVCTRNAWPFWGCCWL